MAIRSIKNMNIKWIKILPVSCSFTLFSDYGWTLWKPQIVPRADLTVSPKLVFRWYPSEYSATVCTQMTIMKKNLVITFTHILGKITFIFGNPRKQFPFIAYNIMVELIHFVIQSVSELSGSLLWDWCLIRGQHILQN